MHEMSYNNKDISEEEAKKLSSELVNEGMINKFEYAHDCFYTMEVEADDPDSIYDTITYISGNAGKVRNAKTTLYDGIWNVTEATALQQVTHRPTGISAAFDNQSSQIKSTKREKP